MSESRLGLQILRGARSGQVVAVPSDRLTVGSSATCGLALEDLGLAPLQFTLESRPDGCLLTHGGEQPATHVNRRQVDRAAVRAGDLIQCGGALLAVIDVGEGIPRNPLEETQPKYSDQRRLDRSGALQSAMGSAMDGASPAAAPAVGDAPRMLGALTTLNRLGYELHVERAIGPLLSRALAAALELVPAADRAVALLEREGRLEVVASRTAGDDGAADRHRVSRTVASLSIRDGLSTISADAIADQRFARAGSVREAGLRSVLCVPLVGRARNTGALYLDAARPEAFTGADLEWVALVGLQTGIALERTLVERTLREREEAARELATALGRQKSYLETILAETRDGFLLLDDAGHPLLDNRALRDLLGQPAVGATATELQAQLDTLRPRPADALRRVLGVGPFRGQEVSGLVCELTWPEPRRVSLTAATVLTEGGALGRLVVVRPAE